MSNDTSLIRFSINSWEHLYSLKTAIERKHEYNGGCLAIRGIIRNQAINDSQDTTINIEFYNVASEPEYEKTQDGSLILGNLQKQSKGLSTQLDVDDDIFNELKKNLMEYGDLDGIHIVVSLELEGQFHDQKTAINILDLSYAMKGDA